MLSITNSITSEAIRWWSYLMHGALLRLLLMMNELAVWSLKVLHTLVLRIHLATVSWFRWLVMVIVFYWSVMGKLRSGGVPRDANDWLWFVHMFVWFLGMLTAWLSCFRSDCMFTNGRERSCHETWLLFRDTLLLESMVIWNLQWKVHSCFSIFVLI